MPAPSCPRIAGNSPSGSAPDRVNSSVWQMPVALISTITSPAFGPSSFTVASSSGFPAAKATAALTSMRISLCLVAVRFLGDVSAPCPQRAEHEQRHKHEQEQEH